MCSGLMQRQRSQVVCSSLCSASCHWTSLTNLNRTLLLLYIVIFFVVSGLSYQEPCGMTTENEKNWQRGTSVSFYLEIKGVFVAIKTFCMLICATTSGHLSLPHSASSQTPLSVFICSAQQKTGCAYSCIWWGAILSALYFQALLIACVNLFSYFEWIFQGHSEWLFFTETLKMN